MTLRNYAEKASLVVENEDLKPTEARGGTFVSYDDVLKNAASASYIAGWSVGIFVGAMAMALVL